ncbi:AAA family ATPase [Diplocarpon mali]|nr:AAA family ATPase [Diplocarpon mali]
MSTKMASGSGLQCPKPPGTGKSSLSSSIAGHFGLNIYILSLSTINEANLKSLFDKLPSRCVILLEDIDAVSSNRDTEVEDSRQITTGSPSQMSKSVGGKVSLSYLLNVIDGVGSQEGRILIMTTNHITRLNEALIRPGRVDKKVELGLADNKMTADLFCLVFKPVEGDVTFTEDAQIASKLLETSEDIKPEDIQSEIARDPKWDEESSATEVSTEMVQQPAPPTSPNLSASKCFVTFKDMQIVSAHTAKCTCSHTPPEDASDRTSTFCSSTFPTNQPQPQIVTTAHVQQFFDILRSLSTKQEPPPPPASIDKGKSEEPPARASKLEFKTVNEVWDTKAYKYKIVESITLLDEENELDRYIFVVRTRIDRTTEKQTHHVDIKSEGLRDVLRSVLQDVKGICLRETKPSVEQNLLFHYLSDLEAYRSNTVLDDSTLQHLSLLVDFIKKTYESTAERLSALFEKCEITYDLLWAFFKPNAVLYTTCVGTGKPRCVNRIMVDAIYFREANLNYARASIDEPDKESSSLSGWTILGSDDSEKSPDAVKKTGMEPSDVKGDDLLICSPTLLGFSLGNKLWAEFAIDDIRDIEWQPEALSHLQIPQKKKKAIHALLEAHIKRASSNSCAGKTLTAEVLSEYFQMPLYAVSAGELGRTAEELESRLPLIFERASKWNALLLLDEADFFLEQRSIGDINRNALVCVFLRTLEYYQGIMFFTTNRVKQIDDAIASRIHFKVKYDILGPDQRRGVWEYFLKKATTPQGPLVYSKSGLESLVQKPLNGRQIKNLTSTAHALALQEGTQVTLSHLEFAIEAGEDFERDVNGAGSTEAMRGYF